MFQPLNALTCLLFATSVAACDAAAKDLPHSYEVALFPGFPPWTFSDP